MAFLGALMSGLAGQATQKVDNYKTQVAEQARMQGLEEQQREFDARQAQNQTQYDTTRADTNSYNATQLSLQKQAALIAKQNADRENAMWYPGDVKTHRSPGLLYLDAKRKAEGAGLQNESTVLANQGKSLANQSAAVDLQYAPFMNQLKVTMEAVTIANNRNDTVAHRDEQAATARKALEDFQLKLAGVKTSIKAADPASTFRAYSAAAKDVFATTKALEATQSGLNGLKTPVVSDKLKLQAQDAIVHITQDPDPMAEASRIVSLLPPDPVNPLIAQSLFANAVAETLRRKMASSTAPTAAVPTPAPPIDPFFNKNMNAGPMGNLYGGGSQGSARPTPPQ